MHPHAGTPEASWDYVVDAPPAGSHVLHVEGAFRNAGTPGLAIDEDAAAFVRDLAVSDGSTWSAPAKTSEGWLAPSCVRGCTVRYSVDLDAMADACSDHVDCALRVGPTTLSPALAWLLHPAPKGDTPVTLRVHAPDPSMFTTGLRASSESATYRFRSPELDEGSFTAFGPARRSRVQVAGARIDVVLLGKAFPAMGDADVAAWVADAARCVSTLSGHFPVERVTVFVVPMQGADEVIFGKVLSLAGPSVVLLTGNEMTRDRAKQEWVVVHELFHLGFPSFRGEGRWLGEGLATYYEPLLRARSGWIDEARVWADFARQMPRGLPEQGERRGLEERDDIDAMYWGGALFALRSDVEIRVRTHNAHSLDDVIRAALARGGDATHVWSVADVLRLGDGVTRTTVLREMQARYVARAEPTDIDALLRSLGVERNGDGVVLRDDAPLAEIRRSMTRGNVERK